jgi:hypothetical protein
MSDLHLSPTPGGIGLMAAVVACLVLANSVVACCPCSPPYEGHPIDTYQNTVIDSLSGAGVDSIVAMRCWLGMNGWNGYGWLLWKNKGATVGRYVEIVGLQIDHALTKTTEMPDSIFGIAQQTLLPSEGQEFKVPDWRVSHDSECRVRVRLSEQTGEWRMKGQQVHANPDRLRTHLLKALENPKLGLGITRIDGLMIIDQDTIGSEDSLKKAD